MKRIETLFFQFLWNNRNDPVKRTKMVQPYECDGLRMVDLTSFIKSMKIGWIKRLYWSNQSSWAQIIKLHLPPTELLLTYGSKKLRKSARMLKNPFWAEVLQAWADLIELRKPNIADLLTDSLWCSDHTKFKYDKVRCWDRNGFRFIYDLVDFDTGNLLTLEQIENKYSIRMTFLCYFSLIRSLPLEFRKQRKIETIQLPIIPYKLALVSRNVEITRVAYKIFVETLKTKYKSAQQSWEKKWIRDIGLSYEGSMSDMRLVTGDTYIQSFHFRIISRVITTNRFLHLIGLSENALCTFCSTSIESLRHLFWSCTIVQDFLNRIKMTMREQFSVHTELKNSIFFPSLKNTSKLHILLITLAKLTIYQARNGNSQPTGNIF